MLEFKPLSFDMKADVDQYFYAYGENSCQHSFNSSFYLIDKYDDQYFIKDDVLYTLRNKKCDDTFNMYLFPMCDYSNTEKVKNALDEILNHAHTQGKKVCFLSLTEKAKGILENIYKDKFIIEENRDLSEYIYTYDTLANLPGSKLSSKRYDLATFARDYGSRFTEKLITHDNLNEVIAFQKKWMDEGMAGLMSESVYSENEAVARGIKYFDELKASGILTYVDGKCVGYAFGVELSNEAYDVLVEKGDKSCKDIYKVLNRDLVRMCCKKYKYINREEDIGVPGLRQSKMSYKPDILLAKFVVKEI